jgi:hypothetical protein
MCSVRRPDSKPGAATHLPVDRLRRNRTVHAGGINAQRAGLTNEGRVTARALHRLGDMRSNELSELDLVWRALNVREYAESVAAKAAVNDGVGQASSIALPVL